MLDVIVDPDDLIPEEDEEDNEGEVVLPDDQTLDVEISSASLSSADVEQGETVTVTAEVANRGTLAVVDIPIQLVLDSGGGPSELTRTVVSLEAGETATVTLRWFAGLEGEALPLRILIDPFDLLPERREDNNERLLVLRVRPTAGPNLAVSGADLAFDPDPPIEGEAATVSALVRNTGGTPSGPFVVAFFVGDPDEGGTAIGDVALADLPPGGQEVVQVTWSPVASRGSLGLFVHADANEEVDEADESDNYAFRPFEAVGLADLVLTAGDVTLDPAYPREGEPVTIQATVRNLGNQPSVPTSLEVTEGEPSGTTVGSLGRARPAAGHPGDLHSLLDTGRPGGSTAPPTHGGQRCARRRAGRGEQHRADRCRGSGRRALPERALLLS